MNISDLGAGGYVELASGEITVSHNDDGTKTIPVYARFYQSQRPDCDYVINGSFALDNIPRYPTVALSVQSVGISSVKVTATVTRNGSNINCKIFNFQYQEKDKAWAAHDGGSGDDGLGSNSPAGYYTDQDTYTYTHTYNNLKYYQYYTFRCLVVTSDGIAINSATKDASGNLAARLMSATTIQPPLMGLGDCTIDPTSTGNIVFKAVSNYANTKYGMDVRIDSSAGPIFGDGTYNLTSGSRTMETTEVMQTTSAAWNSAFFPYYKTTTKGKLWIRVMTYDNSGRFLGDKTYIKEVDFSSVDLSPIISVAPTFSMRMPDGFLESLPRNHTVTGTFGGAVAAWDISKITFKGGAELSNWKLT